MAPPVLEVAGVSKRFCRNLRRSLAYGVADIASELMPWRQRPSDLRRDEFWALDDVSFTLAPGEAMAVVGHNGAGKSTLLRIVAGLFPPDAGEVRVNGRVQSVIELGSGFNPLLSGRENAQLILSWQSGAGQSLAASVEAVNAFAELGALFDAPLQSYSSGMRARLAFALATQVPSDLLLLDEVLAVGDQAFQRKCLHHIRDRLDAGGSLLFVSHNVFQIQTVCRRGLLLDHGRVAFAGSAVDTLDRLFESQADAGRAVEATACDPDRPRVERLLARAPDGGGVRTGGPLELRLEYFMPEAIEATFSVSLWSRDLSVCIAILVESEPVVLPAGHGKRSCIVSSLPLITGNYMVRASVLDPKTLFPHVLHGYTGPATPLKVDGVPDRLTILRRDAGQLVQVDGKWSGSAAVISTHLVEQRAAPSPLPAGQPAANGPLAIKEVTACNSEGAFLKTGEPMRVIVRYDCQQAVDGVWGFGIWSADQCMFITGSYEEQSHRVEVGQGEFSFVMPRLPLLPGRYLLRMVLVEPDMRFPLALSGWREAGLSLDVRGEASTVANGQGLLNQIVAVDVEWN